MQCRCVMPSPWRHARSHCGWETSLLQRIIPAMLLDHSRLHSLPLWSAFGSTFQSVVDIKGGDIDTGLRLLHTAIAESKLRFRFLTGLCELAEALAHAGRIAEGLAVLEAGIEQSEAGWLTPSCFASRANFSYCRALEQSRKRRRTSSGKRSIGRADKVRCPGNSALRRASPGCCATGTAFARRAICWRRFMSGSLRGSALPTCEKQSGLSTRCRKSSDLCSMVGDLS
jgi:hypothetical protein